MDSEEIILRFEKERGIWMNLGNTDDVAQQTAKTEYKNSPIVLTIRKLLSQNPVWVGSAQELMTAGTYITHKSIAGTPRELSERLKALDRHLLDMDGIIHERKPNGKGGGKHRFSYVNENPFAEAPPENIGFEGW